MVRASVRGRDGFVVVRATGARSRRSGGLGSRWWICRGNGDDQAFSGTGTETSVCVPVTRQQLSRAFNLIGHEALCHSETALAGEESVGSTAAAGKQQIPRCASE